MKNKPGFLLMIIGLMNLSPLARADLHFPRSNFDLGEIRGGIVVTRRFEIVNQGTERIEIIKVRTSCGCLAPRPEPRFLDPGEKGIVEIRINPLGQVPGPHSWNVQVQYRCKETTREAGLRLTAHLKRDVMVQPAAVTLVGEGQLAPEVILVDKRAKPLTIIAVQTSSTRFKATLVSQGKEQDLWKGQIQIKPCADLPPGRHDETLDIFTSDPDYRHLQVPVTLIKETRGKVEISPAQVLLSGSRGQALPARLVRVRTLAPEPIAIARVWSDQDFVKCQWAPGPDKDATVKIQVVADRLPQTLTDCSVHVEVTSPERRTLTIPITISLD